MRKSQVGDFCGCAGYEGSLMKLRKKSEQNRTERLNRYSRMRTFKTWSPTQKEKKKVEEWAKEQ